MILKKIKFILIVLIFYQTQVYSKSNSSNHFETKNITNYFSGIVALENRNNSDALDFFESSKVLINKHDAYFKKYIFSLVLEGKIVRAIDVIKRKENNKSNFFETYLILIIDSLKRNDFDKIDNYLSLASNFVDNDRLNLAILETIKQYIFVFKEKKFLDNKKDFGNLSLIAETFQRCYLSDSKTDSFFSNLINNYNQIDYSRYLYFYLSYLIENKKIDDAKKTIENIEYINSTLLLSQGKNWIENENFNAFNEIFSCKNHNDIISEFLFLISNLYSSQGYIDKSNFYLNLSNFLNPKFYFNLSLGIENYYENEDYKKIKKSLKNFKKKDLFYYWYRIKKEALILSKTKNSEESLNYLVREFKKIKEPNNKILFDVANYYRNSKKYQMAIEYYSRIINTLSNDKSIKSDLLYRRGASFERIKDYEKSDKDLLHSLKINPDDAYVLNYLAYSWLERNYKIDEAIEMLEIAYKTESDDPYIIDSIGWAYYLVDDYLKAEKFLKRAVELMPDDPIVNDHYGDILWKLNRKIQARYFWKNVLIMDDVESGLLEKINLKIIEGPKS